MNENDSASLTLRLSILPVIDSSGVAGGAGVFDAAGAFSFGGILDVVSSSQLLSVVDGEYAIDGQNK